MKKLVALLLCLLALLGLAACQEETPAGESDAMPTVLDQGEYVLYQNIFFNDQADSCLGKTLTKKGTLTRVYDAFSQKTRYYVWGYMDATKCCDWQWEFVPAQPEQLPPSGSLVEMTGTLTRDEAALDKLWFTGASVKLVTAFRPAGDCEVDMTTMDATLERVQLQNMQYKPEQFQGKTLRLYGRVLNPSTIQHPYYDNAWTQSFTAPADAEIPAIGTMVILTGSWQDDTVQAARVEGTPNY